MHAAGTARLEGGVSSLLNSTKNTDHIMVIISHQKRPKKPRVILKSLSCGFDREEDRYYKINDIQRRQSNIGAESVHIYIIVR